MTITDITIKALLQQRAVLRNSLDFIDKKPEDYACNGYSKEVLIKHYYEELAVNGDALAEFVSKMDQCSIAG